MQIQHIRAVVAIADSGSIRAAARRLGKTQPALTKTVRQLEDELKAPVFRRTSQGVVLTEIGRAVLIRARSVAAELQRLDEEVAQLRGGQSGSVSIHVSPVGAVLIIPRAMQHFRRVMPDVEVKIANGLYPAALHPLREGQIDMLLGPAPALSEARDLTVEPLLTSGLSIITRRGGRYAKARSLAELLQARWIVLGGPEGPSHLYADGFRQNGFEPPLATTSSDSLMATMGIIENDDVCCALPSRLSGFFAERHSIVALDLAEKLPDLTISLMTRAGLPLTPAAAQFARHLRQCANTLARQES